jgi:hypothetical protein
MYTSNFIRVITSRRMRWAGHVASIGEMRNSYIILVGNPVWKRSLRTTRDRWEDNIRMHLREIGWKVVNWIHQAHDKGLWWTFESNVKELSEWLLAYHEGFCFFELVSKYCKRI